MRLRIAIRLFGSSPSPFPSHLSILTFLTATAPNSASEPLGGFTRAGTYSNQAWLAATLTLCLCDSAVDVQVNYLLYEHTDKQGQLKRWTWITNLGLRAN